MPQFKLATERDLKALLVLMPQYYVCDGLTFNLMKAEEALRQIFLQPEQGEVWLIGDEKSPDPIGYLALVFSFGLEWGGKNAFVDELFVVDAHRGKGIGTQALEHAIKRCAQRGIRALRLEVMRKNENALKLYKRLNFVDLGRHLLTREIGE